MKLATDDFRKAFDIVNMVESHAGLLTSQFLKLVCDKGILRMMLTGLCLGEAKIPVPDPAASWTFYLDRRVVEAFLSTTQSKVLNLVLQEGSLVLVAGHQKAASTPMDEVSGYVSWRPKAENLRSLQVPDLLRRELSILATYAPITAAADHLSAVYLVKGYGAIATDSFMMAACIDPTTSCTFPLPVVLAKLVAKDSIASIDLDKSGAGVRLPGGYVYQPVSDRCLREYPIKAVQGLIKNISSIPVSLKIQAGHLVEALDYLRRFIFGTDVDTQIHCQVGPKDNQVLLFLDLVRGRTQTTAVAETVTKELALKWSVPKVAPWVAHIASLDRELPIQCGFDSKSHYNTLTAVYKKRRYVLMVAEME